MKMPTRNRPNPPRYEEAFEAKQLIHRLTGLRVENLDALDDAEASELVELTLAHVRDEEGRPTGLNRNRLSAKDKRRWEDLIEGAVGDLATSSGSVRTRTRRRRWRRWRRRPACRTGHAGSRRSARSCSQARICWRTLTGSIPA